jgi:hypothetical protein
MSQRIVAVTKGDRKGTLSSAVGETRCPIYRTSHSVKPVPPRRKIIKPPLPFPIVVLMLVSFVGPTMVGSVAAEDSIYRHQTLPGSTIRDYSAPSYVTRGDTTHRTLPGSSIRDYSAPSYVTKGDTTHQTLPGTSIRDYRAPSYITKDNTTYQTLPGSSVRDYRAPGFVTRGNVTYQTLPGSSIRDYSKPTLVAPAKR